MSQTLPHRKKTHHPSVVGSAHHCSFTFTITIINNLLQCIFSTPPSQIQTAAPLYNQPNLQRFELRRRYYHTYFFVTIICAGCAHVRRCAAYLIYIRTK